MSVIGFVGGLVGALFGVLIARLWIRQGTNTQRIRERAQQVGHLTMMTVPEAEAYGLLPDGHPLKVYLNRTARALNELRDELKAQDRG